MWVIVDRLTRQYWAGWTRGGLDVWTPSLDQARRFFAEDDAIAAGILQVELPWCDWDVIALPRISRAIRSVDAHIGAVESV